jgi:hypothetical protein
MGWPKLSIRGLDMAEYVVILGKFTLNALSIRRGKAVCEAFNGCLSRLIEGSLSTTTGSHVCWARVVNVVRHGSNKFYTSLQNLDEFRYSTS